MIEMNQEITNMLLAMGVSAGYVNVLALSVGILVLALVAIVSYFIIHKIVNEAVRRIVERTTVTWDDALFNDRLLSSVCHLVPPVLVYMLIPVLMSDFPAIEVAGEKIVLIYVVMMAVRAVVVLFSSIYLASRQTQSFDGHSLKGLMQMLKIIAICVGLIIIVSILINKNPVIILSGLGASAAVLMLIFKDTIVGLVAGVQLSVNDMLKPGDWIEAPKHGVNGTVEDVSLTTVKVRNWDMTIVTVPPYSLVSESFQNWRGMQLSGGRRVKRSVNIDLNSVRFVTDEEMQKYLQQEWCQNFIPPVNKVVNLHLYRHYIEQYLATHPGVNKEMLKMVRQLQSTNHGVPVELYFFTATTEWVKYENIQAEIFDHIIAVAHDFDLRIFQSPSGLDLNSL
ncbi:MAG: mechanosensitive ion channel [Muribaculaceae bacterium]|nr:mechanosensitive ion channel [Muribaculaceae bacterium]